MENKRNRFKKRSRKKLIALLVLVIGICLWVILPSRTLASRFSVVIASNPVIVWFWDSSRQRGVIVSIPQDTFVDAVYGYGSYPISSLWKLGELDTRSRALLAQSVSEVLGVPIPLYVGSFPIRESTSELNIVKNAFSFQTFLAQLWGAYHSNISLRQMIGMIGNARSINPTNVKVISLDHSRALIGIDLPDGSKVNKINESSLDILLGSEFEDSKVRQEAISIGVYNTTKTTTLGSRVSRAITHLGGNVVLVGNSTYGVSELCRVSAKKDALKSYTALFLAREFHCDLADSNQLPMDERVDIGVFVGEAYAKRFESR